MLIADKFNHTDVLMLFSPIIVITFFRVSENPEPYVLSDRPDPFYVTIDVTNKGPDFALFVVVKLINASLSLSRVRKKKKLGKQWNNKANDACKSY